MKKHAIITTISGLLAIGITVFAVWKHNERKSLMEFKIMCIEATLPSTYNELYGCLRDLDYDEVSAYRTDIMLCEQYYFPARQTDLYRDMRQKKIDEDPELKEYCERHPEILGKQKEKFWLE